MSNRLNIAAAFTLACSAALQAAPPAAAGPAPNVASISEAFLAGRADELEAALPLLKDASVPAAEKENIAYVHQAFGENRQPWWKQTKADKTVNLRTAVWGRVIEATYDPSLKNGSLSYSAGTNNRFRFTVKWSAADMDNPAEAEHGFSKGELCDLGIWWNFGFMDAMNIVGFLGASSANTDAARADLQRFLEFRGNITAVEYALPRARRWGIWLYCAAHMQTYAGMIGVNSRKAIASIVVIEVLTHPDKYPTLKLNHEDDATEESIAFHIKDTIEKNSFTVAEDRMLHDAIKAAATTNDIQVIKTGRVNLPQGLAIALDPEKDKPLREKRDAWVKLTAAKIAK